MSNSVIDAMAEQLGRLLSMHEFVLVTAESCTGGGLAEIITRIPGSSAWFDRGFVTYSNAAKQEMLAVSQAILIEHGAVSEHTARAMVEGALINSQAQIGVSITGIAGPEGGTQAKPVGTICLAWLQEGGAPRSVQVLFEGDRQYVRQQACMMAMQGLIDMLESITH